LVVLKNVYPLWDLDEPQTASAALVNVFTDVANSHSENQSYTLSSSLYDADEALVATMTSAGVLAGGGGWSRVAHRIKVGQQHPPAVGDLVQLASCDSGAEQKFNVSRGQISIAGVGGARLCLDSSQVCGARFRFESLSCCPSFLFTECLRCCAWAGSRPSSHAALAKQLGAKMAATCLRDVLS
jgi:hypothetical protein